MAQSIIYKGQKYVRVDSVRPQTRRVRADMSQSVVSFAKKIMQELNQAGIKCSVDWEQTTYTSTAQFKIAAISSGFSIRASKPSPEFYNITKKYESEADRLCKKDVEKETKEFERKHPDAVKTRPIEKIFHGKADENSFPVCYQQSIRYNFS